MALRFYGPLCLSNTPSGGTIFRCTTKDIEERRAKGVATPFNPLGLMRDSILTYFVPTFFPQGDFLRARNGAFDAIKSAAALPLIPLPLRAAP